MLDITSIPSARVPLIDMRTGLMSREWYRFFTNLFLLTGNGTSDTSIPDLSVELNALRLRSTAMALDGEDGEDGMMGIAGTQGKTGATGAVIPGMDGQDADENFPMQPVNQTDYAQGTWTPTVTASVGAITTSSAVGSYTKIGNVVHWQVALTITTNGTGSGNILFTLPPALPAPAVASQGTGRETAATGNPLFVYHSGGATTFDVVNYALTYPAANGYVLRCNGFYFV